MASSSSSSHFNSASVSQSWNHEVFLSFRGEDTRKGFVGHLYAALEQRGIQTYKDDEALPRGESIGPALFKAIQESRIAVIVFSENYADSSWCLDELAYIIECKDKRGQIVMPVFYGVDPSDLRKQKRKYGEAFIKHECDNKHKTESWRKALVNASNLSGWVPKDFANGNEAKCIEDIVATIFKRLSPLITNLNKDLIGIESRLQDLKPKLEIGSGGVCMIGIWGVGGGGKTTLASAAYMEISHQFEASCLLENIREESSKHGLKKFQANMLSFLLKKDVSVGNEIEGKSMIKRSLCHKSVLVILDDVNDRKQLEALAGSHDWFGEGSRIIITTRDKHLLTSKNATIYEVSLLSDNEALKLFSRHAFQKDEPVEDFKTLSQEVVSYAGKLPLALEILGSSLYDKDKDEWKCALAKLKCIPDSEVMERLKISFDGLKHDEKELFLDIACFFRRSPIDKAMMVLDSFSFYPGIGVKVLVQKSLIKVSEGRFDMHDLVVELAYYIVRGEHPDDPEKHSRIWEEEDIVKLCAMGAAAPVIVKLNLQKLILYMRVCLTTFVFSNIAQFGLFPSSIKLTQETEVLALLNYVPDEKINFWFPESNYDNHQHLLDVIGNMKKLRRIEWYKYPASSFPSNFQPTKLGCMMLGNSNLKQLWEGYKLLPNLKILDLGFSSDLMRTPDFKGLPRLERLILKYCGSLEEIHPSIGYHESLVFVNMYRCVKLKTFPPIIRMKKLETLDLSSCFKLHMFPDIQTIMGSLVNLDLQCCDIEIIPTSVGQFCTNLVTFDLSKCEKLKRIEGNFRLLKRLKKLRLSCCFQLEKLATDFFDEECCIEELSLSMTPKLLQFPRFLRQLNLSKCSLRDGDIPSDMSGLSNLQILDLSHNEFSRLHSSLSQIQCLKFLDLSCCENLAELSDLPSSIEILRAEWCESLKTVGDLSNCKWLWKISLLRMNQNDLIGVVRVLHSMLQRNAVEDRFMSTVLPCVRLFESCGEFTTITLQLPHNWYSDLSGFLFCADKFSGVCSIVIKQEMLFADSLPAHQEKIDKNPESYIDCSEVVGYVPLVSLRNTSWWNPTSTHITFRIEGMKSPKVGLVHRKSKSKETPANYSECWEEEGGFRKTFKIIDASKSSEIEIVWRHSFTQ